MKGPAKTRRGSGEKSDSSLEAQTLTLIKPESLRFSEATAASNATSGITPEEVCIISLCFSPPTLLTGLASTKLLSHFFVLIPMYSPYVNAFVIS